MTPKEKAIELVDKYWNEIPDIFFEDAKQCALIAVDFAMNSEYKYYAKTNLWICGTAYYEKVKQEIENL